VPLNQALLRGLLREVALFGDVGSIGHVGLRSGRRPILRFTACLTAVAAAASQRLEPVTADGRTVCAIKATFRAATPAGRERQLYEAQLTSSRSWTVSSTRRPRPRREYRRYGLVPGTQSNGDESFTASSERRKRGTLGSGRSTSVLGALQV
jgi:hypothetical protein